MFTNKPKNKVPLQRQINVLWIHAWAILPRWREGRSSVMSRELCSFSFINLLILEKEKKMEYVRKIYKLRVFLQEVKLFVKKISDERPRWLLSMCVCVKSLTQLFSSAHSYFPPTSGWWLLFYCFCNIWLCRWVIVNSNPIISNW